MIKVILTVVALGLVLLALVYLLAAAVQAVKRVGVPGVVRDIIVVEDQYASFTWNRFWRFEAVQVNKKWHWVIHGQVKHCMPAYLAGKLDTAAMCVSPQGIAAKQLPQEPDGTRISPTHPEDALVFRLNSGRNVRAVRYKGAWWDVDAGSRLSRYEDAEARIALRVGHDLQVFLDSRLAYRARERYKKFTREQRENSVRCIGKKISIRGGTVFLCRLRVDGEIRCIVLPLESNYYRDAFTGASVKGVDVQNALLGQAFVDSPIFAAMGRYLRHFTPDPCVNWVDHGNGCASARLTDGEDRWLHVVSFRDHVHDYETAHLLTGDQHAHVALRRIQSQGEKGPHDSAFEKSRFPSDTGVEEVDLAPHVERSQEDINVPHSPRPQGLQDQSS